MWVIEWLPESKGSSKSKMTISMAPDGQSRTNSEDYKHASERMLQVRKAASTGSYISMADHIFGDWSVHWLPLGWHIAWLSGCHQGEQS